MTKLDIYVKLSLLGYVMQPLVVGFNMWVAMALQLPLLTAILIVTCVYLMIYLFCLQLALQDVDIDFIDHSKRTDQQRTLQYTHMLAGYLRALIAGSALALTILSKVIP